MANRYDWLRFVYITADGLRIPGLGVGAIGDSLEGVGDSSYSLPTVQRPQAQPQGGGGGTSPGQAARDEETMLLCDQLRPLAISGAIPAKNWADMCEPKAQVLSPCFFAGMDPPLAFDADGGYKDFIDFTWFFTGCLGSVTFEKKWLRKGIGGGTCDADAITYKVLDLSGTIVFAGGPSPYNDGPRHGTCYTTATLQDVLDAAWSAVTNMVKSRCGCGG